MFQSVNAMKQLVELFGPHFPGLRPHLKNVQAALETDLENLQTRVFELERRTGIED